VAGLARPDVSDLPVAGESRDVALNGAHGHLKDAGELWYARTSCLAEVLE
jgi:hypothetical protein